MYWAISIAPPFSKKLVMPVARQLWLQIAVVIPAFLARRCSMSALLADDPEAVVLPIPGTPISSRPATGNHSALLRRLGVEGRESPYDLFASAFRALRFGHLVLGDALAPLEDLVTGFAPIFVRRQRPFPTCLLKPL